MAANEHLNRAQFDPEGAKWEAGDRRNYRLGLYSVPRERVQNVVDFHKGKLDDPDSSVNRSPEQAASYRARMRGAQNELRRREGKTDSEAYWGF